jgi:hypothetical protein
MSANSIANLCYYLFGYTPSPFVYGFISTMFGANKIFGGKLAMGCLLYMSFISIGLIAYGITKIII